MAIETVKGKGRNMASIKKTARAAGFLYLSLAVIAPFLYVPYSLIIPGDAATTAGNIAANEFLFRMGIVGDSVIFLIETVLVALLYVLLRPVSKTLSLVAAFSRLAMTTVMAINLLNHCTVLLLLGGADYLTVFQPDQLSALVLLFLSVHEFGVLVWGLFFALHLFFLGYLVYRSGYIPSILGVLLVFASWGYLAQNFGTILLPKYTEAFAWVGYLTGIPEFLFILWLLLKGAKVHQRDNRGPESP
jgi:hypothetical protein